MVSGVSHKSVYSIAAGTAFVDALAEGILTRFDDDPAGLAEFASHDTHTSDVCAADP